MASTASRMSAPERRRQLLDVTRSIVARDGFHAVSIEAVAREAGITRPVVYGHFTDLPGLLEALVDQEQTAVAHLVPGAVPSPDWARLLLDAHQEGWAAVGGAVEADARTDRKRLEPWAPGGGRNPRFGHALLFPSLLTGLEPGAQDGLPSYSGDDSLFEGRAVVRLRSRSGRPRG